MAVETELKAPVADPEKVRSALSVPGNSRYFQQACTGEVVQYSFEKKDNYWINPKNPAYRLRVRDEKKTWPDGRSACAILVTGKTRALFDGIEHNDEQELTISNSAVFENILRELGLEPYISKEKQGSAWLFESADGSPPLLAELSLVKGLGWFIELEIMSDSPDAQALEQNRCRLFEFLDKLELPRDSIEPRPYTELLRARQLAE